MGVMKNIVALLALALLTIPAAAFAQEALPPMPITSAPRAQPDAGRQNTRCHARREALSIP